MVELIEHSPDDDDVAVACDNGVSLVPRADRMRDAPDRMMVAVRNGALVARCSCWWRGTASPDGSRTGVIGHYAAADRDAGAALLSRACDLLAAAACTTVVGPMDGTTWRRYRFIADRGNQPTFFLEPDAPDDWLEHWSSAGFLPLASYTSAVSDDLEAEDPGTLRTLADLSRLGRFDPPVRSGTTAGRAPPDLPAVDRELQSQLSLQPDLRESSFSNRTAHCCRSSVPNWFCSPSERGFPSASSSPCRTRFRHDEATAIDTVIIKTLGVDPAMSGMGLGGALVALVQRRARRLGFRRAIHALMHETNVSRRISDRSARTFRRYVLLSRSLRA